MRRDMELIRAILRDVQQRQDADYAAVRIAGYEGWIVGRHVELLRDAGYLEASETLDDEDGPLIMVRDLTWGGHDFAAALNNDTVWAKMKQQFSAADLATLPLTILKTAGIKLLEAWALKRIGL